MMRSQLNWPAVLLSLIAGLVGGAISSMIFSGGQVIAQEAQRPSKVIEAEKLVIVDKAGQKRISLEVSFNQPQMTLYDQQGHLRASYAANQFSLLNDKEQSIIQLGGPTASGITGDPTGAFLHLFDKDGDNRIQLQMFLDLPSISLIDKDGELGYLLHLNDKGFPQTSKKGEEASKEKQQWLDLYKQYKKRI